MFLATLRDLGGQTAGETFGIHHGLEDAGRGLNLVDELIEGQGLELGHRGLGIPVQFLLEGLDGSHQRIGHIGGLAGLASRHLAGLLDDLVASDPLAVVVPLFGALPPVVLGRGGSRDGMAVFGEEP